LPTSQQQPTGHQNKIKVFIYLFFWYYNKQQPSSIEFQKNIAIYISFLSTITQWRLLCLGVCAQPSGLNRLYNWLYLIDKPNNIMKPHIIWYRVRCTSAASLWIYLSSSWPHAHITAQ
jgi:hypothetical protein